MYCVHNPHLFLTQSENKFNFSKLITACFCTTDGRQNVTTIIPAVNSGISVFWKVIQCTVRILCSIFKEKGAFTIWEFSISVPFEAVMAVNIKAMRHDTVVVAEILDIFFLHQKLKTRSVWCSVA
jgi:hypothetical protein